jgi:protease II
LLYLDKKYDLIKQNITTGESNHILQLPAHYIWDADENYLYYASQETTTYLSRVPLTKEGTEKRIELVELDKTKFIYGLAINNSKDSSVLYITYGQLSSNYLLEMKLKE